MTKEEAAEKVAKILRLAERAGSPAEADTARRQAAEIMRKHGLVEHDIVQGKHAVAFDELLDQLGRYVEHHEVPAAVVFVIDELKKKGTKTDKSGALIKLVTGVRFASLLFGRDGTLTAMKKSIDEVLEKHKISV